MPLRKWAINQGKTKILQIQVTINFLMILHDTQGSRIDPCSMFIHINSYSSINEEAGSLNMHTLARFLLW